jgi:hypothetical protein
MVYDTVTAPSTRAAGDSNATRRYGKFFISSCSFNARARGARQALQGKEMSEAMRQKT